jgi:lysozyme
MTNALSGKQKAGLTAAGIASALAAALPTALPIIRQWEGRSLVPYRDITRVWTVCDGETRVQMKRYTPAQCDALTLKASYEFGAQVLQCVPELAAPARVNQLSSAIKFTYNRGATAFCASTAARHFRAGRWAEGCVAYGLHNKARINGTLTVSRGLVNVRAAETKLCLRGL